MVSKQALLDVIFVFSNNSCTKIDQRLSISIYTRTFQFNPRRDTCQDVPPPCRETTSFICVHYSPMRSLNLVGSWGSHSDGRSLKFQGNKTSTQPSPAVSVYRELTAGNQQADQLSFSFICRQVMTTCKVCQSNWGEFNVFFLVLNHTGDQVKTKRRNKKRRHGYIHLQQKLQDRFRQTFLIMCTFGKS